MTATPDLRARLDGALRTALRERDQVAIAALRSALAAIANAEAVHVPQDTGHPLRSARPDGPTVDGGATARSAGQSGPHFAGAVAGLGTADVPRRMLTEADINDIVQREVTERERAALQYAEAGHADRAERLRTETSVLASNLDSTR